MSWRERLLGGSYGPAVTLGPDMSREQFALGIYEPRVAHEVQARLDRLGRPDNEFGPGGAQADEGFRAMEALVATARGLALLPVRRAGAPV